MEALEGDQGENMRKYVVLSLLLLSLLFLLFYSAFIIHYEKIFNALGGGQRSRLCKGRISSWQLGTALS